MTGLHGNKVVTCASKLLGMKPIKSKPISQVDDTDIAAIRKFMRKSNRKHDKRSVNKHINALSLTTDSDAESTNATSHNDSDSDSDEQANAIAASAAKSIMRKR